MRKRKYGIGVFEMVIIGFLIMVCLKIIIPEISWLAVLAPIWGLLAAGGITLAVIVIIAAVQEYAERKKRRKWRQ